MARKLWAAVCYLVVVVAALTTLSDWRLRLATVLVVVMFAARTMWAPAVGGEPPWGRDADRPQSGAEGDGSPPM